MTAIVIRDLASQADYEQAVDLQKQIWGDDVREIVIPDILKVSQQISGVAVGAFATDGDLVGLVFGMTGLRHGELLHWSHLLAVRSDARDQGIGRRLKQHQRDRLLALGIRVMTWTFDPLVARNAHLNLNRLGATVTEYLPHFYGETPTSEADLGIGTDRFLVRWELDRRDVDPPAVVTDHVLEPRVTRETQTLPDEPSVLVEIPTDIQVLKQTSPEAAKEWRSATRRAFTHYLQRAYVVTGLVQNEGDGRVFYKVERTRGG